MTEKGSKLNTPLQESLLALLLYSHEHGGKVANLLAPELFDEAYADIAERGIAYWKKYRRAPDTHVDDILAEYFEPGADSDVITDLAELYQNGLNAQYLINEVSSFIDLQNTKKVLLRVSEDVSALGVHGLEEARQRLRDLLRTRADPKKPLTLSEYDRILDSLHSEQKEFYTGIAELDNLGQVPARGRLMLILAITGLGKSWFLTHLGRIAMLTRKRVLHITLEMSEEEVGGRYYQGLFGASKRPVDDIQVTRIIKDEKGQLKDLAREELKANFALVDDLAREEVMARLRKYGSLPDNMRIQRWPTNRLTVGMIEAQLDLLADEGFTPDMILLDYVRLMQVDTRDIKGSLGQIGVGLRGIATERNIAVVAAQQATRTAVSERTTGIEHVAEDWSLVATADIVLTMSATKAENDLGLARIFVGKGRGDKDKFMVLISQNYPLGQYAIESTFVRERVYQAQLKKLEAEDDTPEDTDDE